MKQPDNISTTDSVNDTKHKWFDFDHSLSTKGQQAKRAGTDLILQAPFKSVLAASATGLLIGFLISRLRG